MAKDGGIRSRSSAFRQSAIIEVRDARVHNLKSIDVDVPLHELVGIAGVSGSGKTTLVLESLIPGLQAQLAGGVLPPHVKKLEAPAIERVDLVDATPIGVNVRSTVATYSGVLAKNSVARIYTRAQARSCALF